MRLRGRGAPASLFEYDARHRKLWIHGQRCHHGATGTLVALTSVLALVAGHVPQPKPDSAAKPLAAICHAPWELISADLVQGRTLTSYHSIQDDVRNAGAHWLDREVVEDANWVTSRQLDDLPAFNRAMIALFSRSMATT